MARKKRLMQGRLILGAFCATLSCPCAAAEVTLQQDNMKDFDGSGAFVGFGKGTSYATTWTCLDGHGYWNGDIDKISEGYDYVIGQGRVLRTPASATADTFKGDSLILRGGSMVSYSRRDCILDFKTLRVEADANISSYTGASSGQDVSDSAHSAMKIGGVFDLGSCTVTLSCGENRNTGMEVSGELKGEATARVVVSGNTKNWTPVSETCSLSRQNVLIRPRLALKGKTDGFKGQIRMGDRTRLLIGSSGVAGDGSSVELAGTDLPGDAAIIASAGAGIKPSVATLTLGKNALVEVPTDAARNAGALTVTRALTYTAPVQVAVSTMPASDAAFKIPVLTLASGAEGALNADDFTFVGTLDGAFGAFAGFAVETTDAGEKTLVASFRRVVEQVQSMTGGDGKTYPQTWDEMATFTHDGQEGHYWSDNAPIGEGKAYRATMGLRIPGKSGVLATNVFPGASLCIAKEAFVANWGFPLSASPSLSVCEIADLRMCDGTVLANWAWVGGDERIYATLAGRLTIDGTVCVRFLDNTRNGLEIASRIVGDENAKLSVEPSTDPAEGPGRSTSREYLGDVRIAGDASGFRGTVETTVSNILTVASYPGKLVAKTGAIVRTFGVTSTAEIQVGSFADGTEIEAPCDFANGTAGCLVFAKAFSAAGRLRIRPTGTPRPLKDGRVSLPLLKVPSAGEKLTAEKFVLDTAGLVRIGTRALALSITDDGTWQTVSLTAAVRGFAILIR